MMTSGELVFVVIVSIMLALSVLCNILVLIVMFKTPKMMNPTNVLICNLTISDILLAGVVIPQNIHDITHASANYYEGDFLCRIVNFCPLLCIMASIYSMVAISFERKRAIVVSNQQRTTMNQTLRALPIIWFLAFAFCIPTIYEYSEYTETLDVDNSTLITRCGSHGVSREFSIINGVVIFFLAYLVPLALLLMNYGSILWFFRSRGMFGGAAESESITNKALYKGRMNVVKMLILVAVLFALSWLPYFTLFLIEKATGTSDVNDNNGAVFMLRLMLSVFSTAYNFLLYVVYNRSFRNGFKALVTGRKVVIKNNVVMPVEGGQTVYQPPTSEEPEQPSVYTVTLQARSATLA